jgi:hypothetical protein
MALHSVIIPAIAQALRSKQILANSSHTTNAAVERKAPMRLPIIISHLPEQRYSALSKQDRQNQKQAQIRQSVNL